MRIFLFILGVFAAVVCFEKPAAADGPWCADYDAQEGGFTNCGFQTYQQCLTTVTGAGGSLGPIRCTKACRGPLRLGA
jgi:Protein of unknown function (DUF3551)